MASMAVGVTRLASAMQAMNNVSTADFTRLTKNIEKLASIRSADINKAAAAVGKITNSISSLSSSNANEGAKQMAELASGIAKLGYKSSTQAIENIPKLAKAMKELMSTLSTAPRVSQNLIDMTNALAKLSKTGASSGRAASSLSGLLNGYSRSSNTAKKHTFSLSSAIGKLYATYWLLFRAIGKVKDSINLASELTEVQNVVDTTFGKYSALVEEMSKTSIADFGMSELTVKQVASRFQAMGTAMGFTQGKMAEMSINLTKLTADMASFYNVEQKDVAEDLASVFTGETRPLRSYGLDLTEATLKEWALTQGLNANISAMSQAEKAMLRYKYVMANTSAAQGDFAKTSGTWANQIRILAQNFQALGSIIGNVLINVFKPLISGLNSVMSAVISAVETIANALGAIFGWTLQISPAGSLGDMTEGLDSVGDSAGGAADNLGGAADKAKELKKALLGFDEIEKLPDTSDASGGSGGGGGGGGGAGSGAGGATAAIVPTESLFERYKSEIDTLYELGDHISDVLSDAMENIDWKKVYSKASHFGFGLATFLNGLISPRLFGNVGTTIANSLNAVLRSIDSFGLVFEWDELGLSIAEGINKFFAGKDWKLSARAVNRIAHGLLDTFIAAVENIKWEEIGEDIVEFLSGIDWAGLLKKVGELLWKSLEGAIKLTSTVFEAEGIENKIAGVILGLKFLGLGATFGSKIWRVITRSILGKGVTDLATKTIGTHIGKKIAESITTNAAGEVATKKGLGASLVSLAKGALSKAGAALSGASGLANQLFQAAGGVTSPLGVLFDKEIRQTAINNLKDVLSGNVESYTVNRYLAKQGKKSGSTTHVGASGEEFGGYGGSFTVNVDANTKPAEKRVNILGNQLERSSLKTAIEAMADKKKSIKPLEKFFAKNPVSVKTKVGTTEKETQKQLDKFEDLELKTGVKTTTTAQVLQSALGQMYKNLSISIGAKINTPGSTIQNDAQSKLKGFKLLFDATANVTEKKISSKFDNVVPGMKAEFNSKDYGSKFSKTVTGMVANFAEKRINFSKVIEGVTAKISELKKQGSLSLTLSAALSGVSKALSLVFKSDGGVLRNGSWSSVTAYAGGGLPDMGQVFVARESGPELVGRLGGHTAVMNNNQIVSSVSAGVYQAVAAAMSLNQNNGSTEVHVHLEGDAAGVFKLVKTMNDNIVISTGQPALLT